MRDTLDRRIGGFRDGEAERIFLRQPGRRHGGFSSVILRKLLEIEAAITIDTLRSPPGNRREALSGNRKGQRTIRGNDQYRICFVWRNGYAYDIEVTDDH